MPGARRQRSVSGGIIAALGVVLLGIPLYDIWDDLSDLHWGLLTTLVENSAFVLLAGVLVVGGIWLVRSGLDPFYVTKVATWTMLGWIAATVLFGWVVGLQLWVMGSLKPFVIAMDGVLIGTVMAFGLALFSVRTDIQQTELDWEREAKTSLESLHNVATRLQRTETPTEAYETVLDGTEMLLSPAVARITVDGEVVAEETYGQIPDSHDAASAATAPVGDRGRIQLLDGSFEEYNVNTLWLLATHLDRALERIAREQALAEEREQLALLNQTLRHELLNGIQVVQARLQIVEQRIDVPEEHWEVVTRRIEQLGTFVQQMRGSIRLVRQESQDLEPVDLRSTLETAADTIQDTQPAARISVEALPETDVLANDLLDHLFVNLFRNAVEHNDKEAPRVCVRGECDDDIVRIRVADNGPGVPDERKESVFELGEHGTDSAGTGFGLYLVREVIEAYGGDLDLLDNDPEGTVVELSLPKAS